MWWNPAKSDLEVIQSQLLLELLIACSTARVFHKPTASARVAVAGKLDSA